MNLNKVFSSKQKWCQGAGARTREGQPIPFTFSTIVDQNKILSRVNSFSLHGAIAWFYPYERFADRRYKMMEKLRRAIRTYTGKDYYVAEFNDLPTTTFADIQAVVKIFNRKHS